MYENRSMTTINDLPEVVQVESTDYLVLQTPDGTGKVSVDKIGSSSTLLLKIITDDNISDITYSITSGDYEKSGVIDDLTTKKIKGISAVGELTVTINYTLNGEVNTITRQIEANYYGLYTLNIELGTPFTRWVKTRFPSSTATSLSDLTEAQIRELMTVHTAQDALYEWLSATPADFSQFASNRVAMKWIGLRDRICDKLMGVSTILTAMLASTHWEYILKDSVPKMTSNSLPEGEASASTELSTTYQAYKAFNGTTTDADDCWHSKSTTSGYIRYKFDNPICIKKVVMQNRNSTDATKLSAPKDFTIRVSNDASTWTELGSFSNSNNTSSAETSYDVASNSGYFTYAEMTITTSNGSALNIGELNFYGRALYESVPVADSNGNMPIGEVIYSSEYMDQSIYHAYYVFDKDNATRWNQDNNKELPQYIGYTFVKPICVKSVELTPFYNTKYSIACAKDVIIQATNDDTTNEDKWVTLSSTTLENAYKKLTININNNKAYKSYRVYVVSSYAGKASFEELNFYGVSYSEEEFGTDGIEILYDNGVKLVSGEWQKTSSTHSTITFDVADDYVLVNDPSATSGVNGRVGLVYENNNLKTQVAEVYDREGTLPGGYLENWNNPSGTNGAESVTNILTNKGIDKNADITRAICVQDVSNFSETRFACFVTASANVGTFKIAKLYFLK